LVNANRAGGGSPWAAGRVRIRFGVSHRSRIGPMTHTPGSPGLSAASLYMTELPVADWPGLVRWYAETLGLRLALRDEENRFALLEAGRGRLALKQSAEAGGGGAAGRVRLVFLVEDVEAEKARLAALGVAVSEPRENQRESYREVRLTDPEGTPITLFCLSPP
jgi:predicted enzyme related to lactoylglutathione lyase